MVVYLCLQLVNPQLPNLIKHRYGTELWSRTLLDELSATEDAKVFRSAVRDFRPSRQSPAIKYKQPASHMQSTKSCPLCKETGCNPNHYLSTRRFLPDSDKRYLTRARQVIGSKDEYLEDPDVSDTTFDSPDSAHNSV